MELENINFDYYFEKHSPGYVIEIYKDNNAKEFVRGNRITNPEVKSATSDTLYDIASLTKTFTSVLTYIAYEENKINLNETIYNIDNNFINLKDIKVIDLLSHNQKIWTNGYLGEAKDKQDFYRILYTSYIKDNIPTYVDVHYIILGVLLEKIYNISYEELCKKKIFNVLNMNNTTFNPDPDICASNNYEYKENMIIDDIYPGIIHDAKGRTAKKFGMNLGHASLFTTGKDLLTFLETFFNYKLLKKETIEYMLRHKDINEENYKKLKSFSTDDNINDIFKKQKELNPQFTLPRTYNNMGTRYRNIIFAENDVPDRASENSISFSGYTGPMFTIDFDNKIIVIIMCNLIHNSKISRDDRKALTVEMMNKIFDNLL